MKEMQLTKTSNRGKVTNYFFLDKGVVREIDNERTIYPEMPLGSKLAEAFMNTLLGKGFIKVEVVA